MTELTPIELATGVVFGVNPLRLPAATTTPPQALEAAVRPALQRGRCFVSFSGGRDSSAVLAAAAAVARREGLAAPVPLTLRAPAVPNSHESEWQEQVVRHARIDDWVRIEIGDELDCVGPYAARALARHGVLWPFNAHFHVPLLAHAAGGMLLTGVGGDELWGSSRALQVRRRRWLLGAAPFAVRRAVLAPREPIAFPWLRDSAARQARRLAAAESAAMPWGVRARMAFSRGMRYTATGVATLDTLAADAGAEIAHPLLDLPLWSALAEAAPRSGFTRRDHALGLVAGVLLPAEVVARRTKASFDGVFFGEHARDFARSWDGRGVPRQLVDGGALRAHWLAGAPDPHSYTLLQAAWLESGSGDRVQEHVGRLGQ